MTKKFLPFIFFIGAIIVAHSQTTSVVADWDGTDLMMAGSFGNGHFGDSTFAVVSNPNPSGINMSTNVQNWQKADNANTWGGFFYNLPEPISLTGGTAKICLDVYSDHETVIRAKIEKSEDGGPDASFNMNYTTPGEWQQLCYDLLGPDVNGDANTAGFSYNRFTLFPEFGTVPMTDASYFFDNISKTTGGPAAPPSLVIADWDGTDLDMAGSFGNGHFGDSTFAVVANPNPSGINMSTNVQNWQKADNANTWGGFFYNLPEPISITGAFGQVCLDVYSDHETVIRAKIEKSEDGGPDASFNMNYTTPGEWQQLCYDLLGPDVNGDANTAGFSYNRFTLFPEFGTVPMTDASYFFDNIIKITGGGGIVLPPGGEFISNYETDGITIDMAGSFGNGHYGGDLFNVVDNPAPDDGNPSDLVQEWCKANDGQVWGGWVMNTDTLDLTGTKATFCFSVYSDAESLIRLKLEGSPTGPDVRLEQNYTTSGAWQKLCYDFSQPDVDGNEALGNMYFKISFFPDFNTVPAADKCFYFDDIYQVTNGVGMVPVLISDIIKDSPNHSILENILTATDLWGAVDATGVTVFAPTDEAFNALPATELDALMNNTDNEAFNFLLYHVTTELLSSSELTMGRQFIMRNGMDGIVTAANSGVANATIIEADVANTNGVLHITSSVLAYPPEPDFYLHDDFETPGYQNWFGFNWGSADANIWIEPNPAPDDVNNSATVLHTRKYPQDQGPASFQGIVLEKNVRPMNFIGNFTDICVDFLAPAEGSTLRWKLERGITTPLELRYLVTSTKANQWETLCTSVKENSAQDPFDPAAGHIYTRMAVFFDFVSGQYPDVETDYYIDNFIIRNANVSTSTVNIADLENFEMYPNPANNVLTIRTDSPVEHALVYDVTGILKMNIPHPLDKQIGISDLQSGMYFIQLLNKEGNQLGLAKLIKQ